MKQINFKTIILLICVFAVSACNEQSQKNTESLAVLGLLEEGTASQEQTNLDENLERADTKLFRNISEGGVSEIPLGKLDAAVILDGKTASQEELRKLEGKSLYYVLDESSMKDKSLLAFTTKEGLKRYVAKHDEQDKAYAKASSRWYYYASTFYEHIYGNGSKLALNLGWCYYNLGGSWWNDRISSTESTYYGGWTVFYEHSYYRGSQLWVNRATYVPNFGWYGWNDRASSICVFN